MTDGRTGRNKGNLTKTKRERDWITEFAALLWVPWPAAAGELNPVSFKVSKYLHERLIQGDENEGDKLQPMEER